MDSIPFEILEAMVQCFGRSFHYKDGVSSFFLSCGVSQELNNKYRDQAKFVWARRLLTELGQTEEGRLLQRRILTELCRLRDLPDKNVPDRDAGLDALRNLKRLALAQKLYVEESRQKEKSRARLNEERQRIIQQRRDKLESLRKTFNEAVLSPDRQKAGYSLEDLLKELFALFEIEYKKSYRTETQQIDGCFQFEGFHYLVEVKWRQDMPTEQEIGGFKQKVDTKLESTRGVFISIPGFRQEVIDQFSKRGGNIILMDGSHLVEVLEGRFDLGDLVRAIIESAAQKGIAYAPVSKLK
ncbi:MAG: restriction endonuclease [Deltaproteobacteria bacterium]|nr:restriction endonuclease [Deltaproteobacteria bacterium]MBW1967522.1 restriction endonuclease [Deltaproteobacteria bacterium]